MGNKDSLSSFILLALEKSIDGYIRFADFTNNPGFYAYRDGWNYPLKKAGLAKALKRLREGGMVEFIDDQELLFRLTDSGKDKALWMKMKYDVGEWDGKWRLVIWDIPEKRRLARDALRFKLKQLGFTRWQKSVWISKKNCTKVLRDFIQKVGITDWVKVIESDNI